MKRYLALLRGINVGGNALIKMADLKAALTADGLQDVTTYIQSGNVVFSAPAADGLEGLIEASIKKRFGLDVAVVVFGQSEWEDIIAAAPDWWGEDTEWKHNLLVMLKQSDMDEVAQAIGQLRPDIEAMLVGKGVLYQSLSLKDFGRTTGGKVASLPIYKHMTVRNYNTATKLLRFF